MSKGSKPFVSKYNNVKVHHLQFCYNVLSLKHHLQFGPHGFRPPPNTKKSELWRFHSTEECCSFGVNQVQWRILLVNCFCQLRSNKAFTLVSQSLL